MLLILTSDQVKKVQISDTHGTLNFTYKSFQIESIDGLMFNGVQLQFIHLLWEEKLLQQINPFQISKEFLFSLFKGRYTLDIFAQDIAIKR